MSAEPGWLPRVLVCFAVRDEAKRFRPPPGVACGMVVSGIGKRNAEQALLRAVESCSPRLVLTCGYAGGLNPQFKLGDVLFDADTKSGLAATLLKLGAVQGKFHCSDRIAVTAAEKQSLWEQTGADAVEMESGVIRSLCLRRGIPSATVRVISDAADSDLPLDFNQLARLDGNLSYLRLAGALVRSPGLAPKLMRFQRELDRCSRRLAAVLRELLSLTPP